MNCLCLQTISLLLLSSQAAPPRGVRCLSDTEVKARTEGFLQRYWDTLRNFTLLRPPPPERRTCAQLAKDVHGNVNGRSLSPWKYERTAKICGGDLRSASGSAHRLNQDDTRFPHEISFAKCLCEGCIINGHEDLTYNSVLVYVKFVVMKKTVCQHDQKKYRIKKNVISVPVACTCVVPKYAN
ncbi:hypothetical protein Q5P01_006292 [Channa striata]|uniref:Interleukin 17C n=1 Tax=Channa striata TaxID=64152 RepID=A0AA88NCN7_CHASR|nr:hypothetical protein Q5P01_006292 [Channa striata]